MRQLALTKRCFDEHRADESAPCGSLPLETPLGLRMKAGGGERWGPHCSTGFARFLVEGRGEHLNTSG